MPTIRESHQARAWAESFGSDPERYDRTRPRYPRAMVERIVAASPGRSVIDVGSGTGIATRQFQAAGCTVLGVEVDARMAAWARERGLAVEVAAFEDWDPAGRTFDIVVSGTTWHWVEPVAGAAKAAAALRPAGRLALFWNVGQPPHDLDEAFAAVYRAIVPDLPVHRRDALAAYAPQFAKVADGISAAGAFGEPEQWWYDWEQPYTRDEWLDQLPTHGYAGQLPPDTLQELLDGIGAAIEAAGGGFTMSYTTAVVTAAARSTPAPPAPDRLPSRAAAPRR